LRLTATSQADYEAGNDQGGRTESDLFHMAFPLFVFRLWEPAAPESAITADRRTSRTLSGYGQVVLDRKQLTIRVEHIGECDDTCGVGLLRQVAHTLQFSDFTKDFIAAILRLDE